jgi:hypothetical protein
MTYIIYALYLLFWGVFIIGGCSYIVFFKGHHGAWFVLAVALFLCVYGPDEWYYLTHEKPLEENEEEEE